MNLNCNWILDILNGVAVTIIKVTVFHSLDGLD